MADEQLVLTIEQVSEAVRTAMTREEAEESLCRLSEVLEKEQEGHLHEIAGLVFRSLLPAFVMTDADFKTPASLTAPNREMLLVKATCIDWLVDLAKILPDLATRIAVDRTGYKRRMRMTILHDEEDEEEQEEGGVDSAPEDEESDSENTPPNGSPKSAKKKTKRIPVVAEATQVKLDPIVALMQRIAVRCPDRTEWRKSLCDSLAVLAVAMPEVGSRFALSFVPHLLTSDKAAWRVFACEAVAALVPVVTEESTAVSLLTATLSRTRDSVPGVRAAALKASASCVRPSTAALTIAALEERVNDEKASVRRSAVSVFDHLITTLGLGAVPLSIVSQLTLDESLMVRKASVASIVELVRMHPADAAIADLFASTVPHMVTDVETSVVEKVVESFEQCVLARFGAPVITALARNRDNTEFSRRVLRMIVRKNDAKSNKQIVAGLERMAVSGEDGIVLPALALLEEVAITNSAAGIVRSKIFSLFESLLVTENSAAMLHCLRILHVLLSKSRETEVGFVDSVKTMVETRKFSLSILHDSVKCLFLALESPKSVFDSILASAESDLDSVVTGEVLGDAADKAWSIALVGELAGLGFMPSAKGLTALEAIATNRVYRAGSTEHVPLPASLRAAAMVAFGRICLQKESIAKRAVSKFAAHLSKEEHPVVRNNVLIVLGDLCVVYTGMVDQYLPWITTCLSDPNDLIRFQAAVVTSSLLAEDYIKFKGQIVYRLLYLLSDPNVKIRAFAESVFARILFLRHAGSLKTLFVETVCALNGYLRHPAFQGAQGNREFYLTASLNRRREIFEFMLKNIATTEQKFNAIMQLSQSFLAAFVDEDVTNGAVTVPEREDGPAGQVLIDCLWLLSHPALKLSSSAAAAADEAAPAGTDDSQQKNLLDAVQKKTVVENIVPLLIQLNTVCEQKRSPISRYVRECLKELVKDYKDDIRTIIQADTQLAQELLFDLTEPAEVVAGPDDPAEGAGVMESESVAAREPLRSPSVVVEEVVETPQEAKRSKTTAIIKEDSSEDEVPVRPRRGKKVDEPKLKKGKEANSDVKPDRRKKKPVTPSSEEDDQSEAASSQEEESPKSSKDKRKKNMEEAKPKKGKLANSDVKADSRKKKQVSPTSEDNQSEAVSSEEESPKSSKNKSKSKKAPSEVKEEEPPTRPSRKRRQ